MKDIICACGHDAKEHRHGNCEASLGGFHAACSCQQSEWLLLRAHIEKLEAVAEAARQWRDGKINGVSNLIRAIDKLESEEQ